MRRAGTKSQTTVLSGGGISREPIEATLGWKPTASGLRLAWRTVIDESDDAHLWNAAVDAKTGALLSKDDWTSHDNVSDLKAHVQRTSKRPAGAGLPARVPDRSPVAGARRLDLPRVRVAEREPQRRRPHAGRQPGGLDRLAVRLARHRRSDGPGVHDDAGQQRPRLPRPGRQQRAGLQLQPERRVQAALRLPDGPHRARAELPRGDGGEPLLRQQHDPRRPLPLRVR